MRDLLGPTFRWEMVTTARRRVYFTLRVVYALFLLYLLFTNYDSVFNHSWRAIGPAQASADFAAQFFSSLAVFQITAILLLAPPYVAGTIASEKERRTIEYLFATDLSSREIVLGKWLARTLNLVLPIGSTLVILSLASLFGGIGTTELLYLTALSLATLYLATTIAIGMSTLSKSVRDAIGGAYLILLAWLVLPLVAAAWIHDFVSRGYLPHWMREVSEATFLGQPYGGLGGVLWSNASNPLKALAISCGLQFAGGTLILVFAIQGLRPIYRRSLEKIKPRERSNPARFRWVGRMTRRVPSPPDDRPMLWKEWYLGTKTGWATRIVLGLLIALLLVVVFSTLYDALRSGPTGFIQATTFYAFSIQMYFTLGAHATYLLILSRGSTTISAERMADTWTSLIATPLDGREIIDAKILSACKPGLWLTVLFLPIHVICLAFGIWGSPPGSMMLVLASYVVLAVHVFFLGCLGVFFSLTKETGARAMTWSFGTAVALNGIAQFLPLAFITLLPREELAYLVGASVPGFQLAGVVPIFMTAPYREPYAVLMIIFGVFWLTVYGLMGGMLREAAILRFDRYAGRSVAMPSPPALQAARLPSSTMSTPQVSPKPEPPHG